MSTRAVRTPPLRSYRRRKTVLNLDLNTPPVENPEQEGTSNQATSQLMMDLVATVDVEAIDDDDDDDDIVFCSPSTFAEAKNKSQRNCGRAIVVDVDSEEMTHGHKRRRAPASQPVIDFGLLINLESSRSSVPVEKPTPPKEPAFSCPICMGPLVEETSTKCGHIFCKACIRAAIATQAKCPTCRKRATVKGLIRVFLPATNVV